jgi:hypothetical protein
MIVMILLGEYNEIHLLLVFFIFPAIDLWLFGGMVHMGHPNFQWDEHEIFTICEFQQEIIQLFHKVSIRY